MYVQTTEYRHRRIISCFSSTATNKQPKKNPRPHALTCLLAARAHRNMPHWMPCPGLLAGAVEGDKNIEWASGLHRIERRDWAVLHATAMQSTNLARARTGGPLFPCGHFWQSIGWRNWIEGSKVDLRHPVIHRSPGGCIDTRPYLFGHDAVNILNKSLN